MKKFIGRLLMVTTLVITILMTTGCDMFIKTNKGHVDLKWYMGLTYEDEDGKDKNYTIETKGTIAAVALEDKYAEEFAIIKDDYAYVSLDTVVQYIDKRFYEDSVNKLLIFTDATKVYKTKIGNNTINETEEMDYEISFMEDNKCYINLEFVKKFVDYNYKIVKEKDNAPAIVVLDYTSRDKEQMTISKNIEMRTKQDYLNLIVTTLKKNTKVTVLEVSGDWTKVATDDGYMGFVPSKKLKDSETKKVEYKSDKDKYTHILLDEKVSLGWNSISNPSANAGLENTVKNAKGLNVISPTWYSLSDNKGNLSSLASETYVEQAHGMGLDVWALVNDFGSQDKKSREYTKKVLTNTSKRENLVNNIMANIRDYNLDGINIDFEFINEEIADSYLQFLRELSVECRKAKKVLSIDNYAPSSGTDYYDREQQAMLADYIVVMSYDEHYAGDDSAGSVASMTFTEKSITDTIEQTKDASRVINGMPFYTRAWIMTPENSEEEGGNSSNEGVYVEDKINGSYFLTSQAITMDVAKDLYKKAGVKPTFDSTTGQNFVSYQKGESTVSIWLEDETSVKSRLELMKKYELGGVAYWRLGQESDSIWKTIAPYFE